MPFQYLITVLGLYIGCNIQNKFCWDSERTAYCEGSCVFLSPPTFMEFCSRFLAPAAAGKRLTFLTPESQP